jgi:electron transfer flavoprotein beta subunit
MAANRAEIPTLNASSFEFDLSLVGLKGSPTKVKKSFTPALKKSGIRIREESGEAAAKALYQLLSDAKLI